VRAAVHILRFRVLVLSLYGSLVAGRLTLLPVRDTGGTATIHSGFGPGKCLEGCPSDELGLFRGWLGRCKFAKSCATSAANTLRRAFLARTDFLGRRTGGLRGCTTGKSPTASTYFYLRKRPPKPLHNCLNLRGTRPRDIWGQMRCVDDTVLARVPRGARQASYLLRAASL
jgi:hypothetical protein